MRNCGIVTLKGQYSSVQCFIMVLYAEDDRSVTVSVCTLVAHIKSSIKILRFKLGYTVKHVVQI